MASNRRLLIVLIGWAGFSVLFAAWLAFSWGGETTTQWFDDIGEFVLAFIAAGARVFAALPPHRRNPIARALIGVSAFSLGAGEGAWAYYELLGGPQKPFPPLAHLGHLIAG